MDSQGPSPATSGALPSASIVRYLPLPACGERINYFFYGPATESVDSTPECNVDPEIQPQQLYRVKNVFMHKYVYQHGNIYVCPRHEVEPPQCAPFFDYDCPDNTCGITIVPGGE